MKTAIFGQFDNLRSGVFDRNGQKAHLRTNTFHLILQPNLYDLPFKSSSPYKLKSWKPAILGFLANLTTSGGVF